MDDANQAEGEIDKERKRERGREREREKEHERRRMRAFASRALHAPAMRANACGRVRGGGRGAPWDRQQRRGVAARSGGENLEVAARSGGERWGCSTG